MVSHVITQHALHSSSTAGNTTRATEGPTEVAEGLGTKLDHMALVRSFISRPGKRIRAGLLQAGYELAGGHGEPPQQLLDFVELLHAGSLVIDDIEDDSEIRRGQQTLHRQVGVPMALNAGNWMYFSALEKLALLQAPASRLLSMLRDTVRTIRRCHEGQAIDLAAKADQLSGPDLIATARRITRLKTGELTGLAARLGGSWATSDRATLQRVGRFGVSLGTALQMQNDFQELLRCALEGQPSDDLKHRRVTWPWAWAAVCLPSKQLKNLQIDLADESIPRHCLASTLLTAIQNSAHSAIEAAKKRAIKVVELNPGFAQSDVLQSILKRMRC